MLIAKLRMGVAPLRIELGRYKRSDSGERGIPVESRICQCCNARRVEDEVHFVVECAAFAKERRRLWAACAQCPRMGIPCGQREFRGWEAKEVFVSIMREPGVACALGRFLEESFGRREKLLSSRLVGSASLSAGRLPHMVAQTNSGGEVYISESD